MNKDIRIAVGFLDHPKTIKLRRSLGWEGFEALLRLWCWSAQYRPDGVLLDMTDEDIEIAAQWKGEQGMLVAMLVALRFADREECHLVLHDWAEHNGWAAHARERSEKARKAAAAKWEKGKNAEKDAPSNATSNATSNAPSPSPSPSPTNSYICPEPESPDSGPPVVEIVLNDKSLHPVYQDQVDEWQELFPSADVVGELRKMSAWAKANPTKRKTSRGIDRAIVSWLSKEQDRGGNRPNVSQVRDPYPFIRGGVK